MGEKTRNGRHLKMFKVQSNFYSERVKLLMPLREIPFISSQCLRLLVFVLSVRLRARSSSSHLEFFNLAANNNNNEMKK